MPDDLDDACRLANQAIGCPRLPVDAEQREMAKRLLDGKEPVGEWEVTCADALRAMEVTR